MAKWLFCGFAFLLGACGSVGSTHMQESAASGTIPPAIRPITQSEPSWKCAVVGERASLLVWGDEISSLQIEATTALLARFPPEIAALLQQPVNCMIVILRVGSLDVASLGTTLSGPMNGEYKADILIGPFPAIKRASDMTKIRRLMAHEMAGILLDLIGRRKPDGFRFFDSPPWFVQGLEHYLALRVVEELGSFQSDHQLKHDVLQCNPTTWNPYTHGTMFVSLLFGTDAHAWERILLSQARSFDEAFFAELGRSPMELCLSLNSK